VGLTYYIHSGEICYRLVNISGELPSLKPCRNLTISNSYVGNKGTKSQWGELL